MRDVEAEVVEVLRLFRPDWSGDLDDWQPSDLGSLEYLEIMFELEERFNMEFDDSIEIKSPRELVALIKKELARDRHKNGSGAA